MSENELLSILGLRRITQIDRRRLAPNISGWNRLNEIFILGTISEDDLRKMLYLEMTGKRRVTLIKKLVGRIIERQRKGLLKCLLSVTSKHA